MPLSLLCQVGMFVGFKHVELILLELALCTAWSAGNLALVIKSCRNWIGLLNFAPIMQVTGGLD